MEQTKENKVGYYSDSSHILKGASMLPTIYTVADIIEEVKKDICDNYCKYSEDEKKCDEMCPDCPLNRLG